MTCSRCGAERFSAEAQFCTKCGYALSALRSARPPSLFKRILSFVTSALTRSAKQEAPLKYVWRSKHGTVRASRTDGSGGEVARDQKSFMREVSRPRQRMSTFTFRVSLTEMVTHFLSWGRLLCGGPVESDSRTCLEGIRARRASNADAPLQSPRWQFKTSIG